MDAGFPARTLAARLAAIGIAPASIAACVMTHEHIDHVRGAAGAAKRWGWTLHATEGTASGYAELAEVPVDRFVAGATVSVGRAEVATVRTSHDATEPVGLVVTDRATGARAAIVYDLGHASEEVRAAVRDVDVLVIEANHHGLATQTVCQALGRTRFAGRVSTAAQHAPVGPFCAKHSRASARVEQLALAL